MILAVILDRDIDVSTSIPTIVAIIEEDKLELASRSTHLISLSATIVVANALKDADIGLSVDVESLIVSLRLVDLFNLKISISRLNASNDGKSKLSSDVLSSSANSGSNGVGVRSSDIGRTIDSTSIIVKEESIRKRRVDANVVDTSRSRNNVHRNASVHGVDSVFIVNTSRKKRSVDHKRSDFLELVTRITSIGTSSTIVGGDLNLETIQNGTLRRHDEVVRSFSCSKNIATNRINDEPGGTAILGTVDLEVLGISVLRVITRDDLVAVHLDSAIIDDVVGASAGGFIIVLGIVVVIKKIGTNLTLSSTRTSGGIASGSTRKVEHGNTIRVARKEVDLEFEFISFSISIHVVKFQGEGD